MLFASSVNPTAQQAKTGHQSDEANSADAIAGLIDRETCLEHVEQHMMQLNSHTCCLRGVKERTLLLLDASLSSSQLPSSGVHPPPYNQEYTRAGTVRLSRVWGVSGKTLRSCCLTAYTIAEGVCEGVCRTLIATTMSLSFPGDCMQHRHI